MKDCAIVDDVGIVLPTIQVSMTMKITMYALAVMVQDVLNVRSNYDYKQQRSKARIKYRTSKVS